MLDISEQTLPRRGKRLKNLVRLVVSILAIYALMLLAVDAVKYLLGCVLGNEVWFAPYIVAAVLRIVLGAYFSARIWPVVVKCIKRELAYAKRLDMPLRDHYVIVVHEPDRNYQTVTVV